MNQDEGLTVGDENMFGPVNSNSSISLNISLNNVLSESDRIKLENAFSLGEIKFAVFNMKHNQSPWSRWLPIVLPTFLVTSL